MAKPTLNTPGPAELGHTRRFAHIMKFKTISSTLLAGALVLSAAGTAHADVTYNDINGAVDNAVETVVLAPGETKTVTLTYVNTNEQGVDHDNDDSTPKLYQDTENRCGAHGTKSLVLDVSTSNPAVASLNTNQITIQDCDGTASVIVTAVGVGTAEIRFSVAQSSTASGTQWTTPADFDVQVVAPDPGRDAPAIANEYLHQAATQTTLDACRSALGTNKTKSNWHGNLISMVAKQFEGQTFTTAQETTVVTFVRQRCNLT